MEANNLVHSLGHSLPYIPPLVLRRIQYCTGTGMIQTTLVTLYRKIEQQCYHSTLPYLQPQRQSQPSQHRPSHPGAQEQRGARGGRGQEDSQVSSCLLPLLSTLRMLPEIMSKEAKASMSLGFLMGAFLICWLPFFIWMPLVTVMVSRRLEPGLTSSSRSCRPLRSSTSTSCGSDVSSPSS